MEFFEQNDLQSQWIWRLFVAQFFQSIAFDVDVQFKTIVSRIALIFWGHFCNKLFDVYQLILSMFFPICETYCFICSILSWRHFSPKVFTYSTQFWCRFPNKLFDVYNLILSMFFVICERYCSICSILSWRHFSPKVFHV